MAAQPGSRQRRCGARSPECRSPQLAAEYGTPLFVIDEDDFRSRCRDIAAAFGGGEHVHYAAKAFLCTEIARWVDAGRPLARRGDRR